jgi:hypothetical protein
MLMTMSTRFGVLSRLPERRVARLSGTDAMGW